MKKKWWILCGILAAVLLSLGFFGVRIRVFPRLITSKALGAALEQLEERFEDSPACALAETIDPQGRQRMDLQLETELEHLGVIRYDMVLNTQLSPNRILAEGSVITGGKVLDISLFLDEKFAAVSSRGLLEGQYYGITYDSFSQDIRQRQLLTALLGEELIGGWEFFVEVLSEKMATDLTLPEYGAEDIRAALYGALTLKPEISREEITMDEEGGCSGYSITFRATGAQIREVSEKYQAQLTPELAEWIGKMAQDPQSRISVQFVLYRGKLVQIQARLDTAEEIAQCALWLGEDPEENPLSLELITQQDGQEKHFSVMIRTEQDEEHYEESLSFMNGTTVDYQWDLSSGELELEIQQGDDHITQRLNLTEDDGTLTLRSQNIRPLLNLLLEQEKTQPAICTLTVSPGGEVAVPEYRNLDRWSMEDLLTLLSGFGDLLGLKLP